jgi:hypothetical protein
VHNACSTGTALGWQGHEGMRGLLHVHNALVLAEGYVLVEGDRVDSIMSWKGREREPFDEGRRRGVIG